MKYNKPFPFPCMRGLIACKNAGLDGNCTKYNKPVWDAEPICREEAKAELEVISARMKERINKTWPDEPPIRRERRENIWTAGPTTIHDPRHYFHWHLEYQGYD